MKINTVIQAFNRGLMSTKALARVDIERTQLSAEVQTNFIPRTLGSATIRPGLEYKGARIANAFSVSIPFVFAIDDTAELELTDSIMRVWVDDELVSRETVTATITNGLFTSDISGWTDNDESGAISQWKSTQTMALLGTGVNAARRTQEITVNEANTEHALRVDIFRGPVTIKVGTSSGDDSYISAVLKTGIHSLAFTPTGNFFIDFSSTLDYTVLVDSVAIESAGVMTLTTPWTVDDLPLVRYDQSGDVVFVACYGIQQRRIERRDNNSWSIVLFEPEDGPFGNINVGPVSLTPSAISGDITLTASRDYWTEDMVGELYKLTSSGQTVSEDVTAENTFTGSIFVTGVGSSREFSISISNSFSATVTLQRSTDDATWEDVETYTTTKAITFDDELDNLQYYYRIGVKTGDFTSGQADLILTYGGGSLTGIVRIVSYASSTTIINAAVLTDLGGTDATFDWYRSQWSTIQGYPSAVAFYEGRLWFSGKGGIWGSVSDGYESFDNELEGDSGPINRTFGSGPVDKVHWILPMQRLIFGVSSGEVSARSTSFDEPLSPTNFNLKTPSRLGSSNIQPVNDGSTGMFVQRSGNRLYQLQFDLNSGDYAAKDLTSIIPEIGEPYIVRLAIQKQPDTRVHCVRSDGTVALLVKDDGENMLAWVNVETDGQVEDVYVFPAQPGEAEDTVYYTVKRTINGSTVRYREKWAFESNTEGGSTNKIADSFVYYSSPGSATLTGLDHLEGETVVIWADGVDVGTDTVVSGSVTLSSAPTTACVGLGYTWQYKTSKLAYAAAMGTALNQKKRVNQLGIIAQNLHPTAFQYGPDFDHLYDLPAVEGGQVIDSDAIRAEYDEETFPFAGVWDTDSRICLQGSAPKPCTLLAIVFNIETHDKD